MELQDRKEIGENIAYLIKAGEVATVKNIIIDTHPADLADIIRDLDEDDRAFLFDLFDPQTASDVLTELDEVSREQIVEKLGTERISEIVDEMDSDDAADFVAELPDDVAKKVLSQIDVRDRIEVEKLLGHHEETAGGIMGMEFVAVYDDEIVDDAIREIRQKSQEVENVYNVYAIDRDRHLTGVISLKKLILSHPKSLIKDIMYKDVISVTTDMDQEQVANVVRKYDLVSMPVVDKQNRLVGRITIDDIVDVLQEEATEDLQRMAGISEEEILQEMSAFRISRFRLPWLTVAFMGEIVAALVLSRFAHTFQNLMAITWFVPAIMAMGGNSGIQASTIVVRSLALAEGGTTDWMGRVARELKVGLLNGTLIGLYIFAFTRILSVVPNLKIDVSIEFGLVISLAMLLVIIMAALVGSVMPIILSKLKFDPAIATGPFITTSNDVFGLLIYLLLATSYLKWFRH
ncbi:magnesium transporter [candidate division KSB1 bacterium RBG_16_48_16]|nr:MAG: magnesium transporter [candidate division KSB1 bacterium RBG_16_48_16]